MRPRLPSLLLLWCGVCVLVLLSGPSSSLLPSVAGKTDADGGAAKALYCALCEAVVDEVDAAIALTASSHGHTVQTKWRIDEKRHIPYARTEHRLMEIIEDEIQPHLPLYGAVNHTDRLRLLRQFSAPPLSTAPLLPPSSADATEGVELSDTYSPSQFQQSAGMTSTLKLLYDRMIEGYLEEMLLLFHRAEEDIKSKLCIRKVRACPRGTTFEPFAPPEREVKKPTTTEGDTQSTPAEGEAAHDLSQGHSDL